MTQRQHKTYAGSVWDTKRKRADWFTRLILAMFLALLALNLTPGYRAAQERNRVSVQTPTHLTGSNDSR